MSKLIKESIDQVACSLEKAAFLDFLSSEIDSLESVKRKNGLSPWVISGAIATLMAYFFSILEKTQVNWISIGKVFIFSFFLVDLTFLLFEYIQQPSNRKNSSQRFFIPIYYKQCSIITTAAFISKYVLIFIVFRNVVSDSSKTYIFCVNYLIFLILITMSLSILTILFGRKHKKYSEHTKGIGYFVFIFFTVPIFLSFLGSLFDVLNYSPTLYEWEIGIIFGAILVLINIFFSVIAVSSAMLADLKEIRQKLSLGLITLTDAKQETENIVLGLTSVNIEYPHLKPISDNLDALKKTAELYEKNIILATEPNSIVSFKTFSKENERLREEFYLLLESFLKKIASGRLQMLFKGSPDNYYKKIKEDASVVTDKFMKVQNSEILILQKQKQEMEQKEKELVENFIENSTDLKNKPPVNIAP